MMVNGFCVATARFFIPNLNGSAWANSHLIDMILLSGKREKRIGWWITHCVRKYLELQITRMTSMMKLSKSFLVTIQWISLRMLKNGTASNFDQIIWTISRHKMPKNTLRKLADIGVMVVQCYFWPLTISILNMPIYNVYVVYKSIFT